MPTVDIKGVGQAQFPDGMSAESIREFLRNKYSQQAVSNAFVSGNKNLPRNDARYGELGVIKNKSGSVSTEYSITENIPELGGWVNIPTLVKGQVDRSFLDGGKMTGDNYRIAIQRAIQRKKEGAILPSYDTLEDAVSAAEGRGYSEKMKPYSKVESDMLSPRADTITPYEPTLTEKMGQGVSNALYDSGLVSDRYGAQRVGETISSIGEFLPGVGDATAGDEFGRAVAQGDKVGMGIGLLGAIPIAGDAFKKGIKKLNNVDFFDMSNKDLTVQTVKENTENIAFNVSDPVALERMGVYEAQTGKKPVLQFTNTFKTTFINADGTAGSVNRNGEYTEIFEQDAQQFMRNKSLSGNKKRIEAQQTPEEIAAEKADYKKRRDDERAQYRAEQEESYKMQHTAPMRDGNPGGNDVNDSFPGIYSGHASDYLTGVDYDQKAIRIIQGMKGKPEKTVTIYRAVPNNVKSINSSDWVTTTKEYAQDHMKGEEGWHILSKKVKAKDIATDGNSIHEFGYDPAQ